MLLPSTDALASSDPYFAELPVVLTASRMVQSPLDAPAPVTIIDREMIDASGFTEIHDLLRLVPGFVVADWPDGSPVVANHGIGDAFDRRIKVLIDGRNVNSPLWGDVNWQDLPVRVDDIERIEVVRGPNGAAYGANAFQGVINILTRSPLTEHGVSLIVRRDDRNFRDAGVRINGRTGGAFDWRLSASRRAADNFRSFDGKTFESIERDVVNLSGVADLSLRDELRVHAGVVRGDDRRGSATNPELPARTDGVRENYLHLAWHRSLAPESEFSLQYYHQGRATRVGWTAAVGPFSIPANADADTQRDDLEFQLNHRFSRAWHLLWGAGVRRDAARSRHYFNTNKTIAATHWQTFGSLSWQPTDALLFNAGGTLERHDYSGTLFSPRLALNYRLSPHSSLRLSSGTAYRAPSLMESRGRQNFEFRGQIIFVPIHAALPVDPERVRYTELGYVARLERLGLDLDTRIFHERYSRYLDDRTCRHNDRRRRSPCSFAPLERFNGLVSNQTAYFVNSGAFTVRGLEAAANWSRLGWGRIVVSQAFIEIREDGMVSDDDIVASAPHSTTSILLIKDLPWRWKASVGYYHTHPIVWLNDGDRVPTRDRYDFRIARAFGQPGSGDEFAFVMQNGGARYPDFDERSFRHEPRVYASLRVTW